MSWRQHRAFSVAFFVLMFTGATVFYVVLLRQFGALPDVRKNREEIIELQAKVDSLRDDLHRLERSSRGQGTDR